MNTKIVLFKSVDTVISRTIVKVTESDITHSATLRGATLYDASEVRKTFGSHKVDRDSERQVEVYELDATDRDFEMWLREHKGMKYDFMGIFGWLLVWMFGRGFRFLNAQDRVFCFEATAKLITRVTGARFHANVSGRDLKIALGRPIFTGTLKQYCTQFDL